MENFFLGMLLTLIIALVLEIVSLFLLFGGGSYLGQIGIACIGILVYGMYIIVDIKMISERIEVDDYILGAMTVYIDLMSLFLYILALIGKKKD